MTREKVLKILKKKGYDSVRVEVESELKADGEIWLKKIKKST